MTPSARGSLPGWLAGLAAAAFFAHLAVVALGPYGPHRDALLYYAMGENLHLFAMDAPPFIALVARAFTMFGNVELLTHVPVAGAHAMLIIFAGLFARRAGGERGAQAIAAVSVATAPVFLRAGSLFQPVVFDQLWWTAALWVLASIGGWSDRPGSGGASGPPTLHRPWLLLGAILGLGLMTKFTALVLGVGIFIAIVATPLRRSLRTPWPWLAAVVALVVGSPSIVGQLVLDWPFLGQFRDLANSQLTHVSPMSFIGEQAVLVGPVVVLAVVAIPGTLARTADPGPRAVAWAAAVSFVVMLLAGGKAYYIAPIWPALLGIAIGRTDARLQSRGTVAEQRAGRRAAPEPTRRRDRMERVAVHGLLWVLVTGWGVLTLPLGLPLLPPEAMARYAARLGEGAVTTNTGERLALPQDHADMLGWEELAVAVESAWRALPPADRERAVILTTNYGRAGAIDWFVSPDLPPTRAPVGSYWYWGPGELPGEVVVVVGHEAAELEDGWFGRAVEVARVSRPWGVPEERDVPIVIARDPTRSLQQVWPGFRGRN